MATENYISISYKAQEPIADIINALLMAEGCEGIEEGADEFVAFFPEDQWNLANIQEIFVSNDVPFASTTIPQQNWNARWESSFEPVTVGNFATVRANFHEVEDGTEHDIIITPKMSFGTGHHATTYLMIEAMQNLDFKQKTVFDFGTGTGVLAILAEKLGASRVIAIDNDEWSINNAIENLEANYCTKVELLLKDAIPVDSKADIMLCNINLNVILKNILAVRNVLKQGGIILFSGLLQTDEQIFTTHLQQHDFSIQQILFRNNWMLVCASL